MARWIFFTKRKRGKEEKRKREKEFDPNNAVKTDSSIISTAL